jgi:hypothetical protein
VGSGIGSDKRQIPVGTAPKQKCGDRQVRVVRAVSIGSFEGSRFVHGGRYGISIDFGLEVIEKKILAGRP